MRITPLDIQKHEFPARRWGGYDPDEVRSFLQLVAEAHEEVAHEASRLQEELKHAKEELEGHRERERILKNTLLQAQAMVDEIKDRADKQAALVVKEAEIKAERLVSQALVKTTKVENSIAELRILRNHLRLKLRSMLSMVESVLKAQEEDETEDEKLRFLRKEGSSLDDERRP